MKYVSVYTSYAFPLCLLFWQSEVKNKALRLEELHCKVNDLKELTKNPETPPDLQVSTQSGL